ncbi:MAG: NAD-dependent dehydratase [Chloroflexi bacterium]|nr:MAG: NAD-dependent dehydratase [Chloroflexota bacterium]MBL1197329.1 NAD-dependent dehydratase [Chloroflexota bacterium]NOH14625.1 NAD(P)H-binding protein [Chloroflexota bacterium]
MNSQQNLHVIFGTGPLGLSVASELVAQGKAVRLVNRSGQAQAPEGAQVFKADANDSAQARQATEGASVVYHCAMPPYNDWPRSFPPLTNSILAATADAGARLVFGDNLYAYGHITRPMTEDMPLTAETRKGKVRAQMERTLIEAHEKGTVEVAIGKGSDFYGPRVLYSGMGERVFPNVLAGKAASVIGPLDVPHTYTYIEDFARGLVILGERSEALGESWHIPNAQTLTTGEFIALIAEEAGVPYKASSMPKLMMNIVSLFIPALAEMKEMLYEFEEPFIVDHSKFEKAFGDISTPLEESIRKTLDWYREDYK